MRIINRGLLFSLIPALAFSAPFLCRNNNATYQVSAHCNTACGTTCEELDPLTSGTSGTCDKTNYEGFVYFNNKTYTISKATKFWTDIPNLAQPATSEINDVIKGIAGYYGGNGWIGVYDPLKSNNYNAIDPSRFKLTGGIDMVYTNWKSGQPDNKLDNADIGVTAINGEHWAYIQADSTWLDDGYHVLYGGDYKPRRKALAEWNGPLDCVNGTPKPTTSDASGYWCGDGAGNLAECNMMSYSATPTCTPPATWNPDTLKCEAGGTYTYPAYYSEGTRLIDITTSKTLVAGIDFPADTAIHICMAGGGGSNAPRVNKDDGGGGGAGAVSYSATYTAGTTINATIGEGSASGVCGGRGGTTYFGSFAAMGGYNACGDSGGAGAEGGGKGGNREQSGGSTTGCGGTFVGGRASTISDGGGGGGGGGFGNGANDGQSAAPNTGAGAGGRKGVRSGGTGRIVLTVPAYSCDPGDILIGETCTKDRLVQTDGQCDSGYVLIDGQCTKAAQECPLGNYQCTEISSSDKVVLDGTEGVNDKQNDGQVDSNGNCLGNIYIFNGQDHRCRIPGIQTGFTDCCQKGTTWFGLGQCKESEKTLGKLREFGSLDGNCHYVGSYCAEKWPLVGCVQKKKTYCCFSSPLARIIQEGGRPQLGIGWGSPEAPQCRGFTPEEFQKIDFSKVNFSEWIQYDVVPNVQNNAVGNIQNVINNIDTNLAP